MTTLLARLTKPSETNEAPTERDLFRTEIAVIVVFIFALFLGIGIRGNAMNNHRTVTLGDGLPRIAVPAGWITGEVEGALFYARNPRSPGFFNSEVLVATRSIAGEEANVVTVRTGLGLQRTQDLLRYRELEAQAVTVNNQPALLVTYAYVADPTRDQGAIAPPVVVQAQDLIFGVGDTAVIVTVAADAAHWDAQEAFFQMIYRSLNVRGGGE